MRPVNLLNIQASMVSTLVLFIHKKRPKDSGTYIWLGTVACRVR